MPTATEDWTLYVQRPGDRKPQVFRTQASWTERDHYEITVDGERYWAQTIDKGNRTATYVPKPLSAQWGAK